jgi:hypothetical protein
MYAIELEVAFDDLPEIEMSKAGLQKDDEVPNCVVEPLQHKIL